MATQKTNYDKNKAKGKYGVTTAISPNKERRVAMYRIPRMHMIR
jgi:hypothetical protein